MARHNDLGKVGEDLAVDFLIRNDYHIRARNFRFEKTEVDIIAQKEELLIIVEVKTRSTTDFGNPQDFIKPKQIANLVKAVNAYVEQEGLDYEVRFDVIAIIKNRNQLEIEHLKDAFYHF